MANISIDPISNVAQASGPLADAIGKIIGIFKASATVKQDGQIQLDEIRLQGEIQTVLAQIEVNKTEASNQSIFVAGWRPFIGWICGAGVAYGVILQPFAILISVLSNHAFDPKLLPTLDFGTIMTLLGGLLGLGAMRTYEKVNNAANPGNIGN